VVTSDSESEEDRNELELSWDKKELMILDLEEKTMKEEDMVDVLSEPLLPVGKPYNCFSIKSVSWEFQNKVSLLAAAST